MALGEAETNHAYALAEQDVTTLRDVTFENPNRYINYGKLGKVISPELISSGIFTGHYYPASEEKASKLPYQEIFCNFAVEGLR